MTQLAQNSFSIKKIIDGRTLTFNLSSNKGTTQIESKDPKSYNPNYPSGALVITPSLFASGSGGENLIASAVRWKINGDLLVNGASGTNNTKWGATVGSTGAFALSIAKNLTTVSALNIQAEYTYTDPVTLATTKIETEITITKVENAGTTIIAQIDAPQGNIFSVHEGISKTLELIARLVRGGVNDTTNVTYKWAISVGGSFYDIIASTAPVGSGLPAGTLFSGANTQELTIYSDAVLNMATIRVTITDTDTASTTRNKTAVAFQSLIDMTDPFVINIKQPQGDSLSQSSPSSEVKTIFEVWQKNSPVSAAFYQAKTFRFYRHTSAGVKDTTWVPSPAFAGWTVAAGVVSKTFPSSAVTEAHRTVSMKLSHLLPTSAQTVFEVTLE